MRLSVTESLAVQPFASNGRRLRAMNTDTPNKDTFQTVRYRSAWIHSHYDRTEKREVVTVQLESGRVISARTYAGAKRIITRLSR